MYTYGTLASEEKQLIVKLALQNITYEIKTSYMEINKTKCNDSTPLVIYSKNSIKNITKFFLYSFK